MDLKLTNKINSRLKFLYRKNRYLSPYIKGLLCNALIHPHFDYACSAWYPNLNKKFNSKLQTSSNINEVIRAVLNSLFFYEKTSHAPKALKALKAQKALKGTKTFGQKHKTQISE